jgi:octaprenyl-diphosphate synthase
MASGHKSLSLNELYRGIQPDLDDVESRLREISRSSNPLIAEVNRYLFQKGGKRIRPALLILSARMCGYKGGDHVFWSALVEIIHTASLIHDDIIDNSTLRRGQDTVHAKWGANISVLLGDFLYIQSIALALKTKIYPIIDLLADVTAAMVEGELIEFSMSGRADLTEDVYLEILDKKTAALFACACRIGGLLAGIPRGQEERLHAFGTSLGLAFQIVDDLLDFNGEEKSMGKRVLTDFREGRVTLPLIHAVQASRGRDRARLIDLIEHRKTRRDAPRRVRDIVLAAGGLNYAHERAADYVRQAKESLAEFPAAESRRSLERIADLVLQRNS